MPCPSCFVLTVLLAGPSPGGADALLSDVQARYSAIGRGIMEEDLSILLETGFRMVDGDAVDVERVWKESFQAVQRYGPVELQVRAVAEEDGAVVAEVRRRIFFVLEGDEAQQFEEGRSRDRWRKQNGRWRLTGREELPGKLTGSVAAERKPVSPRLARLLHDVQQDKAEAPGQLWDECRGKCPLVEAINDDAENLLVTFLWRDDSMTERVEVRGGPQEGSRTPFDRLPGTDVWYHSERLPKDSRYVYSLIVTRWIDRPRSDGAADRVKAETYPLDPLNPLTFNAGSVCELPGAPRDAWHIERPGVERGRLEHCEIKSSALAETRGVTVYTPPGFNSQHDDCALAVFLDGEDCEHLLSLPAVMDNLSAGGKIRPTVALLVDSRGTRGRDLVFSDAFVEFLAAELVPWSCRKLNLRASPGATLIGGMSLGGLTAAYAAQKRPEVFGNVLSQSGSFWRRRPDRSPLPEGWLPGEVAARAAAPVRYYLEVGRFEAPGMVENNRRMRDVLRAKGYEVIYNEYHGGHDHVNWRVSVGSGILALLPK